mgnify:CR=1 FL=1|tara:strand:- start:1226 stop:1420 length:195 start_codon:yes stop_codon:yes gene_type:complete
MKAVIEFEISKKDAKSLKTREEKKEFLTQYLIHHLDEWLKGQTVINIEFIETDEETIKFDYIHE